MPSTTHGRSRMAWHSKAIPSNTPSLLYRPTTSSRSPLKTRKGAPNRPQRPSPSIPNPPIRLPPHWMKSCVPIRAPHSCKPCQGLTPINGRMRTGPTSWVPPWTTTRLDPENTTSPSPMPTGAPEPAAPSPSRYCPTSVPPSSGLRSFAEPITLSSRPPAVSTPTSGWWEAPCIPPHPPSRFPVHPAPCTTSNWWSRTRTTVRILPACTTCNGSMMCCSRSPRPMCHPAQETMC